MEDLRSLEDTYVKFILVTVNLNPTTKILPFSSNEYKVAHQVVSFSATIFSMWCGPRTQCAVVCTRLISRPFTSALPWLCHSNWGQASLLLSCGYSISSSEEHRGAQKHSSFTESLGWGRHNKKTLRNLALDRQPGAGMGET